MPLPFLWDYDLMGLTRIDCDFSRLGGGTNPDTSSFVAINPKSSPGSLLVAGACAARGTIGSQVACRLSLEHFVEGALSYFSQTETSQTSNGNGYHINQESSLQALEAAFKQANNSVYSFGHKLAAGGRLAASLIGLVVEDKVTAAGRVGAGSAYLYRSGELFPFFETSQAEKPESFEWTYVGTNSLVSVELASVPTLESDLLLVFSNNLDANKEAQVVSVLADLDLWGSSVCQKVTARLKCLVSEMSFFMCAYIGPDTIYLDEKVT